MCACDVCAVCVVYVCVMLHMAHCCLFVWRTCDALLSSANLELESWLAAIRPMLLHEVPHSLLAKLADFTDERLDRVALPHGSPPHRLPCVPLPPDQAPPTGSSCLPTRRGNAVTVIEALPGRVGRSSSERPSANRNAA